jgi:hypothetical protein
MNGNAKRAARRRAALTAAESAAARELAGRLCGAGWSDPPAGHDAAWLADFLRQTAELVGGRAGPVNYHTALARAGVWFVGYRSRRDWPAPLRAWSAGNKPQPQQCFYNSVMAAAIGPAETLGLSYFEGQVVLPGVPIPIEHAWLGTPDGGAAVDLTFDAADRTRPNRDTFGAGSVYCGVMIPTSFVTRLTYCEETAAPRLGHWLAAVVESRAGGG